MLSKTLLKRPLQPACWCKSRTLLLAHRNSAPVGVLGLRRLLVPNMADSAPAANTDKKALGQTQQQLVMQIVVRRDLLDAEGWGVGPLMAQVAHATSAVLHETRECPETRAYLDDLKNMRKAVMQTADQSSIERLVALLAATDPPIPHHLWVEQPENVPTCVALAPNRRESKVKKALDKSGCRLWKG